MSDPVWYYARGETEKGPLSTAQIKALAAAGKLRPDDYVWKEGMDNWLPAAEVPDLFPAEAGKAKEKAKEPDSAGTSEAATRGRDTEPRMTSPVWRAATQEMVRQTGRSVIAAGLLAVLLARGCDGLGERYVARQRAMVTAAEYRFRAACQRRRQELQQQIKPRQEAATRSQADKQELAQLEQELKNLEQEQQSQEALLRKTQWFDLEANAELSDAENQMWAFWRELAFQFGTALLVCGLITVACTSEGAERWMCFVGLAILLHRICVPGAWPGK
jgi:hypothetical protein